MLIELNLSDECRARELAENARALTSNQTLTLTDSDLEQLTAASRAVLALRVRDQRTRGEITNVVANLATIYNIVVKLDTYPTDIASWEVAINQYQTIGEEQEIRAAQMDAERKSNANAEREHRLVRYHEQLNHYIEGTHYEVPWNSSLRPDNLPDDLIELEQKAKEIQTKRDARAVAAKQAQEAAAQMEREVAEAERAAWIDAHGSDFLKLAIANGYDCQRRYITERAVTEHPGYTIDFDDRAEWRSRSCPSESALTEALTRGATVVWLTAGTADPTEQYDEFEPCEAIAIRKWLGKYDLIKVVEAS